MRQLVGLSCARCEKTIPSIIAGQYCPECGCPVHNKCAEPNPAQLDSCHLCGSSLEAVKANHQEEKLEATNLERDTRVNKGLYHLNIGVATLLIGAPLSFFCGGGLVAMAVVLIGLGQVILGAIIMMRQKPPQY
jgi:hypothetical protein